MDESNYVNGVGNRYVIWVQGCNFKCKGCNKEDTWGLLGGSSLSAENIFQNICEQEGLFGVTFTGGEPLLQASELIKLSKLIKDNTTLHLQLFTGFEINEKQNIEQKKLLKMMDVIVYGRFDSSKKYNNQTIWTKKISKWVFNDNKVEVELYDDGGIIMSGYPPKKIITCIKGELNGRIQN